MNIGGNNTQLKININETMLPSMCLFYKDAYFLKCT